MSEYLKGVQAEAHLRGLPKNYSVKTQPGGVNRWQVTCSCGEVVVVGSAPYPQTKSEKKRLQLHADKHGHVVAPIVSGEQK